MHAIWTRRQNTFRSSKHALVWIGDELKKRALGKMYSNCEKSTSSLNICDRQGYAKELHEIALVDNIVFVIEVPSMSTKWLGVRV